MLTDTEMAEARHNAESRVNGTPELQPFRDLLLETDFNLDDHLVWVAKAPVAEIVAWAEDIRRDEADD